MVDIYLGGLIKQIKNINKKQVHSSIFRKFFDKGIWHNSFNPLYIEELTVERAKKYFSLSTRNIEILTNLRHYGCDVNLIDFTHNPYIALFFSCVGEISEEEGVEENGQFICLKSNELKYLKDIDYSYLKTASNIGLIEPSYNSSISNRIIAQDSVFVCSPKGYLDDDMNGLHIKKIKHDDKIMILDYLMKVHHIVEATIYNDVIGFIKNEENTKPYMIHFYKGLSLNNLTNESKENDTKSLYKKLIIEYDSYIKSYSLSSLPYFYRGSAKQELSELKEAIIHYDKAIELLPNIGVYYGCRGSAKQELGELEEAIIDYDKAIELDPKISHYYFDRGSAKQELGELEEAIIDYDKAIELDPKINHYYYGRGLAKMELGKIEEAIIDYDKAQCHSLKNG